MRPPRDSEPSIDGLFAEVLSAGERPTRIREVLARKDVDETRLIAVLRRAVPMLFLEAVSATPPWSDRPRVLGGVVLNPRTPRTLALRLLPALYWRDLADVAASPRVTSSVRVRAEALLKERLPELRLGDRITLGRIAPPAVLPLLLADSEAKVVRASLANPRLREADLLVALRQATVSPALLEQAAASSRWCESYGVHLELVLQARTPLAVALAQLSSLLERDLLRVSRTSGIAPLVQAAALRVAREKADGGGRRGPDA